MANNSFLAVTAKAKDEVTGPMAAAAKAYADAGKALQVANQKIVQSEKEKKAALEAARQAQKQAKESADNLREALSGLSGAMQIIGKQSGLSLSKLVLLEAGLHAAAAAARAMINAVGAGISAVVDATVTTVDKSSKFGLEMAKVSSIVDDADNVMGQLTKSVLQLSGEFGKAPTDVAKSLYEAVSAGATDAASAISVLTTANKIAVAGQGDVAQTIKVLTSTVNAFGGSMRETKDISDAVFTAIKDGNITAQEFATQLGEVVGTARMVGLTFDETAAATAAITLSGIPAAEAVTALNTALNAFIKPGRNAKAEAKALGIEFNAMAVTRAGGFAKYLQSIRDNANFTSETFGKLFGNIRGIKGVFASTANDGAIFEKVLGNMAHKAGATDEAFARISDTLEFQRQRFAALRETATITIGDMVTKSEGVKGALEGVNLSLSLFVAEMLSAGTATFGTRDEMNKLARDTIADLIDGFATLLDTGDSVSTYFSVLGKAIKIATAPIRQVVDVFASIPSIISDIDDAIGAAAGEMFVMPPAPPPTGFEAAANAARRLAAAIREGKETAASAAVAETAMAEAHKKQLEEIELFYNRLKERQEQEAAAANAKKDADKEYREWVRQEQAAWAEEQRRRAESKRRADDIERQGNELLLKDALASLQMQEDAAKRVAEAQKEARDAFDAAEAAALDALEDRQKDAANRLKEIARDLYSEFRSAFTSIIDQSKSFGQAMLDIVKRIGLQIAESLVMRGIGAAIDGLTAGLGGGALTWLGKIFGFADGGVVGPRGQPVRMAGGGVLSGGTPGKDSIPVLAMEGEGFLPRDLTSALRRALAVPEPPRPPSAPAMAAASSGAPMQFVFAPRYEQSAPMTSAQELRHYRDTLVPALRQLAQQGHLDFITTPRRR